MDDLALLSRLREDVPERSEADVVRGRAALLRSIDAPPVRPTRTRRSWVWIGAATAATCGLAGAFVVAGLPGTPGSADPAAAAVLTSAATAARTMADPVVGAGQYLEVRTDAVYAASGTTEVDAETARRERGGDVTEADTTSFLESEVSAVWMPFDRAGDWIYVSCMRAATQTFGPRSETLAAESAGVGADVRRELPGGRWYDGSPFGMLSDDDLAALPQDPAELLEEIYRRNGSAGPSRDGEALVWIADRLRSGILSAETRSLFYDTAALIPGVTITEQQATLNGRTGTAIGRDEAESGFRQDIVIDPETGAFIGERQVLLRPVADMPEGTAIGSTSVTTMVVSGVPEGTSLCTG